MPNGRVRAGLLDVPGFGGFEIPDEDRELLEQAILEARGDPELLTQVALRARALEYDQPVSPTHLRHWIENRDLDLRETLRKENAPALRTPPSVPQEPPPSGRPRLTPPSIDREAYTRAAQERIQGNLAGRRPQEGPAGPPVLPFRREVWHPPMITPEQRLQRRYAPTPEPPGPPAPPEQFLRDRQPPPYTEPPTLPPPWEEPETRAPTPPAPAVPLSDRRREELDQLARAVEGGVPRPDAISSQREVTGETLRRLAGQAPEYATEAIKTFIGTGRPEAAEAEEELITLPPQEQRAGAGGKLGRSARRGAASFVSLGRSAALLTEAFTQHGTASISPTGLQLPFPSIFSRGAQKLERFLQQKQMAIFPHEDQVNFSDWLMNPRDVDKGAEFMMQALAEGGASTALILAAAVFGGPPTAFAMAYALNYPDVVDELIGAGMNRDDALVAALGPNVFVGLLDTAVPAKLGGMVRRGLFKRETADAVARQILKTGRTSVARHALRTGAAGIGEMLTESTQEAITMASAAKLAGADYESTEILIRLLDAGMAGLVPGTVLGGGSTIAAGRGERRQAQFQEAYYRIREQKPEGPITGADLMSVLRDMQEEEKTARVVGLSRRERRQERKERLAQAIEQHREREAEAVVEPEVTPPTAEALTLTPEEEAVKYRDQQLHRILLDAANRGESLEYRRSLIEGRAREQRRAGGFTIATEEQVPTEIAHGIAYWVHTDVIHEDPQRFQFRELDPRRAKAKWLEGTRWDTERAGLIQVWRDPADGKIYVVNGHNRVARLKELGGDFMNVQFIDAPTALKARAKGALTNISEGHADPIEAALWFRTAEYDQDDLQTLPMAEKAVRRGLALANLTDAVFDAVVRGNLSEARGVIIGQANLPAETELAIWKYFRTRKISDAELRALLDVAERSGLIQTAEDQQIEAFGVEDMRQALFIEQAEIEAYVRGALLEEAKAGRGLRRAAERYEARAGEELRRDIVEEMGVEEAQLARQWNMMLKMDETLAAIVRSYAETLAKVGKRAKQRNEVKAAALTEVLEYIQRTSEDLGPGPETGPGLFPDEGEPGAPATVEEPSAAYPQSKTGRFVVVDANNPILNDSRLGTHPNLADRFVVYDRETGEQIGPQTLEQATDLLMTGEEALAARVQHFIDTYLTPERDRRRRRAEAQTRYEEERKAAEGAIDAEAELDAAEQEIASHDERPTEYLVPDLDTAARLYNEARRDERELNARLRRLSKVSERGGDVTEKIADVKAQIEDARARQRVLHEAMDRLQLDKREAAGQRFYLVESAKEGQYTLVATPAYRDEVREEVRERRTPGIQPGETQREYRDRMEWEQKVLVPNDETTGSPAVGLPHSWTLNEWLEEWRRAHPAWAGKVHPKPRKRIPTETAAQLDRLAHLELLIRYLQANPQLIERANRDQIDALSEIFRHTTLREGRELGISKTLYVKEKDTQYAGSAVEVEVTAEGRVYHVLDHKGKRTGVTVDRYRVRSLDDRSRPYNKAFRDVQFAVGQRGGELLAEREGRKEFGEPVEEMGRQRQEGLWDEFADEMGVEPGQLGLPFEESATEQALADARERVSRLLPMWNDRQPLTTDQLRVLYASMQLISAYNAQGPWPFSSNDYHEIGLALEQGRTIKERKTEYGPGQSLDPMKGPDAAAAIAFDLYPSDNLPEVAILDSDAKLKAEVEQRRKEAGIKKLHKIVPSRQEMIDKLQEALMIPISTGRVRWGKHRLGLFKVRARVIRTKFAQDIETTSHEVGHALMGLLFHEDAYTSGGELANTPLRNWSDELQPLVDMYDTWRGVDTSEPKAMGHRSGLKEGFAEWVRLYLTNPSRAKALAPRLHSYVSETLKEREPAVYEALDWASAMYARWRNAGPQVRIMSNFIYKHEGKRYVFLPPWRDLRRQLIDHIAPMEDYYRTIFPGKSLTAIDVALQEQPHLLARFAGAGAVGVAEANIKWGIREWRSHKTVTRGLDEILAPVLADWETRFEATAYWTSRRVLERNGTAERRADAEAERMNDQFGEADRFFAVEVSPGEFQVYDTKADHLVGLRYKGFILGFSLADARATIEQMRRQPEKLKVYDAIFDELQDYRAHFLQWLVDAGAMTQETRDKILEGSAEYLPLKTIPTERISFGPEYARHSYVNVPKGVYRMRGRSGPKQDPIEALYADVYALTNIALRARVAQSLYELAKHEGSGYFMEELTTPTRPHVLSRSRMIDVLRQYLDEELVEDLIEGLDDSGLGELLMFFQPGDYFGQREIVRVLDRDTGKYRWFQVRDQALWESMMGVEKFVPDNAWIKLLIQPWAAKTLRLGATLAPAFVGFRNPSRDMIMSWIQSEWGIRPYYDHIRGLFTLLQGVMSDTPVGRKLHLRRPELYEEYVRSGAAFASLLELDRRSNMKKLEDGNRSRVSNVVLHSTDAFRIMGSITENMSRMAEFRRAYEALTAQGVPHYEAGTRAAYAARDVSIDFNRHGAYTRALRLATAFWNANLQGWDKLARTGKEHPWRTGIRALMGITYPSILFFAANYDDDDYWSLPQWMRDFYWLIPANVGTLLGGTLGLAAGHPFFAATGAYLGNELYEAVMKDEYAGQRREDASYFEDVADPLKHLPLVRGQRKYWIKLPKPFVMGQVFGSLAERALEWWMTSDPEGFRYAMLELVKRELDGLNPFPPTWYEPLSENRTNWSRFFRRPLMGPQLEGIDAYRQFTGSTSEVGKLIGRVARKIPGIPEGVSPIKVDNLMYSYFGTLMRDATDIADLIIHAAGDPKTVSYKDDWERIIIAKDVVQAWPMGASENKDRLYREWDRARQAYDTLKDIEKRELFNDLLRSGVDLSKPDATQWQRYFREHKDPVYRYYFLAWAVEFMADMRETQAAIAASNLPDKQKLLMQLDMLRRTDAVAKMAIGRVTPADIAAREQGARAWLGPLRGDRGNPD